MYDALCGGGAGRDSVPFRSGMRLNHKGAWLTTEASSKTDSSILPVKVCWRTERRAASSHSAALCTVMTTD